jgi:hypothetical protein
MYGCAGRATCTPPGVDARQLLKGHVPRSAQDDRLIRMALDPVRRRPPAGNLWLDPTLDLGSGQDLLQVFYGPKGRRAEVPGAGGIGTAQSAAKIWSAAVVPTDGVRLISSRRPSCFAHSEAARCRRSRGARDTSYSVLAS